MAGTGSGRIWRVPEGSGAGPVQVPEGSGGLGKVPECSGTGPIMAF